MPQEDPVVRIKGRQGHRTSATKKLADVLNRDPRRFADRIWKERTGILNWLSVVVREGMTQGEREDFDRLQDEDRMPSLFWLEDPDDPAENEKDIVRHNLLDCKDDEFRKWTLCGKASHAKLFAEICRAEYEERFWDDNFLKRSPEFQEDTCKRWGEIYGANSIMANVEFTRFAFRIRKLVDDGTVNEMIDRGSEQEAFDIQLACERGEGEKHE